MSRMALSRRLTSDRTDFKQITTMVVIGAVLLAGCAGIAAFALSFRASKFSIEPGQVLVYRLSTTTTEIGTDHREGRPQTDERIIALIGIGLGNEAALLAEESRGRDRLSLHRFEPDGSNVLLDAAARPTSGSRAIGIFDFNLFALPPAASDQAWEAQITYGLLPPAKQLVQARVRRSQSKSNPEFQLKPPGTLEWVDQGTYRQVRDLQATYRFKNSLNTVDQATIKCVWSTEQPQPANTRRWRMVTVVELIDNDTLNEDPVRLRAVAVDCAAAGEALNDTQIAPERRRTLGASLRTADTAVARLRQLADRLAVEVLRQPAVQPLQVRAPSQRHQLQVAIGPENQKEQAEQLARTLLAGGFTARVEPAPAGRLRVVVGPYADKDAAILERLQLSYPYLKPLWIEALP
jgi:hypothetical protein